MAKSTSPIRAAGVVCSAGIGWPLVCVQIARGRTTGRCRGKLDNGENTIEAARRETIEETAAMSCWACRCRPSTTAWNLVPRLALLGRLGTPGDRVSCQQGGR